MGTLVDLLQRGSVSKAREVTFSLGAMRGTHGWSAQRNAGDDLPLPLVSTPVSSACDLASSPC